MVQCLRHWVPKAQGLGLTPVWGMKVLCTATKTCYSQKREREKGPTYSWEIQPTTLSPSNSRSLHPLEKGMGTKLEVGRTLPGPFLPSLHSPASKGSVHISCGASSRLPSGLSPGQVHPFQSFKLHLDAHVPSSCICIPILSSEPWCVSRCLLDNSWVCHRNLKLYPKWNSWF